MMSSLDLAKCHIGGSGCSGVGGALALHPIHWHPWHFCTRPWLVEALLEGLRSEAPWCLVGFIESLVFVKEPIDDGVISCVLLEALRFGWFLEHLPTSEVGEDGSTLIDVSYDEDIAPSPLCFGPSPLCFKSNPLCLNRCQGCPKYLIEDVFRGWLR